MKANELTQIVRFIDKKKLASNLLWVIVGSTLLGWFLLHYEAFELFYEYSREHEDWDLDEALIVLITALFGFSTATAVVLVHAGQRLLEMSAVQVEMERKISHSAKLQAMGNLLGGVAHSINNHLVPIKTLAKLVQEELPKDSLEAQDLEKVITAAGSASAMLRQVLNFARQEEKVNIVEACEIGPALECAISLLKASLPSTIKLTVDIQPLVAHVGVDRTNLEIMVINLVNNAVDAIERRSGKIKVTLAPCTKLPLPTPLSAQLANKQAPWVCLKIRDNGKGMGDLEKSRIFDPWRIQV